MKYAIDLFPIAWLCLFFWGMKPVRPFSSFNSGYLSLKTGNYMRGFLAVGIILHHVSKDTTGGFLLRGFWNLGFLFVAVFFFYSGYGLQKSYMASDGYKKHFLSRRIVPILITYLIVNVMFVILLKATGHSVSYRNYVKSLKTGRPVVLFSWYIITIILFYIAFWILMELCRSHYGMMIIGACIWFAIYAFFCRAIGYGVWWYNSAHLLVVGMFWALYEEKILAVIKKLYPLITILTWGLFALSYWYVFIGPLSGRGQKYYISVAFQLLCAMLFVLGVMLFLLKFTIGNPVLGFLGRSSLEIYLAQGLFFQYFTKDKLSGIQSEALLALLVVTGSIALGAALHYLLAKPLKHYKARISK